VCCRNLASRFALVTVAVVVAAAVGLTRLYLRAHWLSDVTGGWGSAPRCSRRAGSARWSSATCATMAGSRHDERSGHLHGRDRQRRAGVIAYIAFILVPAWGAYSRIWQRLAASFLTLYVLAAFIIAGAAGGAAIVYFWDRIGS
jgi:hypothetical protein